MLINPSNFDISINIEGRKMRKIFKAIPGRKPWINDFTPFLQETTEAVSRCIQQLGKDWENKHIKTIEVVKI